MKIYSLAEAFATFLETDSAQKAPKSAAADRRFLGIALHYFNTVRNIENLDGVTIEDLQRFQLWLLKEQVVGGRRKEPWTQPSVEFYCRTLKKFFRKMFHIDRIPKNPAELWKVPRGTSLRRRAMTQNEYLRVYAAAPAWFRPVLMFMRLTGSRGASAADLTWQDLDFDKGLVLLRSRKGGLGVTKEIPIPMYPALREFLESERAKIANGRPGRANDPVFWGPFGLSVTAQEISSEGSRLIRKVVKLQGVVLYGLRHAIAVEFTEAGIPLEITRQAMGHSSIQQTSHYAKGIASRAVADAFSQVRGKKK